MKSYFRLCLLLLLPFLLLCENQYIISNIKYSKDRTSVMADLSFNNPSSFNISKYGIHPLQNATSINLITQLSFSVSLECNSFLHFRITDKNKQRYEPNITDYEYISNYFTCDSNVNLDDIGFVLSNNYEPFTFELHHNNVPYYFLNKYNFLFSDTLIVFESSLTSNLIFGFGERNTNFILENGRYTIWPNDTGYTYEDKKNGGYNLMGHQPIGLHRAKNGMFLGLLFMNTNAQDVVIRPLKNSKYFTTNLEHRTIGGIIDYYITFGNKPDEAIANIHKIIGRPTMPPFWSLGWHQSRWGYNKTNDIRTIYKKYKEHKIPIDTFWGDIDILNRKRNFQYNKAGFKDLPDFIEELHKDNRKFIPIVDYGIPIDNLDPYFNYGRYKNSFIRSNYTKGFLINKVWPGKCVFPDVFSKNGVDLWKKGLGDFDKLINYDGVWLDMNEPGIIEVIPNSRGEVLPTPKKYEPNKNKYEYIPYIPGYREHHLDLQTKGISLNGYSSINEPSNDFYTMYNVRPLISLFQVRITNDYLKSSGRRPFIISRSNTIGHGKYAFHWLGDNASTEEDLKASISGIFNYNIYGVPMTGADICGFHGKSNDALCARWHILGAFYPFSRNHNEINMNSQEPWAFSHLRGRSYTLTAAKLAIPMKYSLMRYFYTQIMLISLGKRGSFFKPLFFEFPNDLKAYNKLIIETHIMVGDAFLFIPNLSLRKSNYHGYFPNENFNLFPTGQTITTYKSQGNNKGTTILLPGNFDVINLFLRGGMIIPYQKTDGVQTSNDLRNRKVNIIINPNKNLNAVGDFICDNDDIEVVKSGNYNHIKINYNNGYLSFTYENLSKEGYIYKDSIINEIIFFRGKEVLNGLYGEVKQCEVLFRNGDTENLDVNYDESKDRLVINFGEKGISVFEIQLLNF